MHRDMAAFSAHQTAVRLDLSACAANVPHESAIHEWNWSEIAHLYGRRPRDGSSAWSARQGPPRGDDQLDGVADDDGVIDQVAVGGVFQDGALHELAVAVAVARVGILHPLHSQGVELKLGLDSDWCSKPSDQTGYKLASLSPA